MTQVSYSIKDILANYWDCFLSLGLNLRPVIFKEVVHYFDLTDLGDPVPPRFDCQKCNGKMELTYF